MSHTEDNQHFDEQMRKRFEDASFVPPPGIWDKIQEDLPPALPFYYRFKYAIVAAILAFSFMSSYFIYSKYDYAYSINGFMTDNLRESDLQGNTGNSTVISGLNLTDLSKFVTLNELRQNEKNYNTARIAQLETIQSETAAFSNGNAVIGDNSDGSNTNATSNSSNRHPALHLETVIAQANRKNPSSEGSLKNSEGKSVRQKRKERKQSANPGSSGLNPADNKATGSDNTSTEALAQQEANQDIRTLTSEEKIDLETACIGELQDDEENPHRFNADKATQKPKRNHHQNRGLYIGPTIGGHYTAMTKSSREGVNSSRMEHKASYGTSYGISAGYIVNNRWTIGMEWIYNSGEGQKFEEKIDDVILNKYIALDYMKIPVYVKYRQKFLHSGTGVPATFNLIGGVHFSRLRATSTSVNGEIEPFELNYNRHQWGLLAGFEFDIYPTNRIFFTFGGRATFNADLQTFPSLRGADGMAPFSVQTGVYAKLHYMFTKTNRK